MTTPRGPTSRAELKIAWDFPVYKDELSNQPGTTVAPRSRHALALDEAVAYIAGTDKRPLLVLRECLSCNGTDDALMTRNQDNERTLLMSRWFHCVKLPPDVLAEDHPFHALFAGAKPGHLFFARFDGAQRQDLNGQQSRTELWSLMEGFLGSEYEKRPSDTLAKLLGLLDRFDRIDAELQAVKGQMDDLIESGAADSAKMKKLQEKLTDLEASKNKTRTEARELSELKLREEKARKTAELAPASGARGG